MTKNTHTGSRSVNVIHVYVKMHFTVCLIALLALHLLCPAQLGAQTTKSPLNMPNVTLEYALTQIEKNSDYTFLYNNQTIDTKRIVSVESSDGNIPAMLDRIFAGTGIKYTLTGKQIILSENKVQQPETGVLKGKVTDAAGQPLIGVSVVIKGTTTGTVTDLKGQYSLHLPDSKAEVEFSYIGYDPQTVTPGSRTEINITMKEGTLQVGEVVVTAMGIRRESKSLTYNVQQIAGDAVTSVPQVSFINALSGKIAGVTINPSSSGIGGSTRVIMRGTKSLFGDNNVLYVLNGIPMMGLKSSQSENYYEGPGIEDSDGISNLNPDDIESMSVLTGASAAALYGNRGANGVILITTKKGSPDKITVTLNNSTNFSNPFVMHQFQNTYGRNDGEFKSWGPKLATPSSYDPADFFQTAYSTMSNVSLSAGSENSQTFVSAGMTKARGIIPNHTYDKLNLSVRNSRQLVKDVLSLDMDFYYTDQEGQNGIAQGMYYNPLVPVYLFPPADNFDRIRVYEKYDIDRNFRTQYWPYQSPGLDGLRQNPYWIVNRNLFNTTRDRYIASASMKYTITDWINISGRARMDMAETNYTRKKYASTDGLFSGPKGNYREQKATNKAVYADVLVNVDRSFGKDFRLVVNAGASVLDEQYDMLGQEGNLLSVPDFFHISNLNKMDNGYNPLKDYLHEQTQSVFGSAQVGYRSMLYIDLTERVDFFSSLDGTGRTSVNYPSVGLSGIITEMVRLPENIISYWKIRASYAGVGNPPPAYLTRSYMPLVDGAVTTTGFYPASDLKAELTKSFEAGTEVRMFNNRLNLELTYYNSNTYNQIFRYSVSPSTGYAYAYANAGKVNNYGIELKAGFNCNVGPVDWNSSLVYSFNRNEIKELLGDYIDDPVTGERIAAPQEFVVSSADSYRMVLRKGGSMGDIYATKLKQDVNGYIYVNPMNNSIELEPNAYIKVGSAAPKYNIGFSNSFAWKGLSLDFLIDARVGGVVVSATEAMMDQFGVSQSSAEARDNGGVIVNGARLDYASYYGVVAGGNTGVLSEYTYSATNVRLRELSLNYRLPKLFKEKLDVTLSLTGRNLWMIYNRAPFDPDLTANTGTYYQGFDYFMPPSLRSFGFGIKVTF